MRYLNLTSQLRNSHFKSQSIIMRYYALYCDICSCAELFIYCSFRSWSRMLKMLEPLKWSFYATITAMTQRNYTIQSLINSRLVLSDVPVLFDFLYHKMQSHINSTLSSKPISTIPLGLFCFNCALAVPRSNLVINSTHHFIYKFLSHSCLSL